MKLSELTDELVLNAYAKTGCTPGTFFNCASQYEKRVCPLEAVGRLYGIYWGDVLDFDNVRNDAADFTVGYDTGRWQENSRKPSDAFYRGPYFRELLLKEKVQP